MIVFLRLLHLTLLLQPLPGRPSLCRELARYAATGDPTRCDRIAVLLDGRASFLENIIVRNNHRANSLRAHLWRLMREEPTHPACATFARDLENIGRNVGTVLAQLLLTRARQAGFHLARRVIATVYSFPLRQGSQTCKTR